MVIPLHGTVQIARALERRLGPISPGAVRCAVAGSAVRSGMYVVDAGVLLVHGHKHIFLMRLPVSLASHGIDWNLPEIPSRHQVIERLRSFLFVESVL